MSLRAMRMSCIPARRVLATIVALLALLGVTRHGRAQSRPLVIRGGTIHTVAGGVIANGTIVVRDGKIASVGGRLPEPADAEVIDARGRIVTPGLIDARTRFGVRPQDVWDRQRLVAADRRVVSYLQLSDEHAWVRAGVTTVYVAPGEQNLLGGYGAVVKTAGDSSRRVVRERAGMSASFGDASLSAFPAPTTRQGRVALLRQMLIDATRRLESTVGSSETATAADSALGPVLRRDEPLRLVAHTAEDIATGLRLADEFKIKLVIDGGAGAHVVADRIAAARVSVVVGPSILALGNGGAFELRDHTPENAGRLNRAGVVLALSTDAAGGRSVAVEAVAARAHGLRQATALRAVTLDAAEILGVANRLGTIQPGKDADLVIWEGHPISTWGESRVVIINGGVVFRR